MTSSSAKVDDIFREAGTAFNKLSEMTMSLQAAEDSLSTEVWSPEDLETLRSSVHRFAVELNKISQHIKIRTMFHLRRLLEMDSGAIQDVQGSPPDANQSTCNITSMYIIQSPSFVTSRTTWVTYTVPVSTYIPRSIPDPTNRPELPQATSCNQIGHPSSSNVIAPILDIQPVIEPLPVLTLSDLEPNLPQPDPDSTEDHDISENELDGFNPEVVPPVPPEQILQPEKRKKLKRKASDPNPAEDEVNNNELYASVQQLLRYLNFEETNSSAQVPNQQPSIGIIPSVGSTGPVPSDNVDLPVVSGLENQVTTGQNYEIYNHVANKLQPETSNIDNDFKQNNGTSISGITQQEVLSPSEERGKKGSIYASNSKYNRPNKQTLSTIKKKKQTQKAVPNKKRTPIKKGMQAQNKRSIVSELIKSRPKSHCQDENARDGDAKDDINPCVYAEHFIDDSNMPIPNTKNHVNIDNKTTNGNNLQVEDKHDPFVFCDIIEPAPDPLSTFRARWCSKKASLKIADQSTSHQPPTTREISTALEITPKKNLKKEETSKTAKPAVANTATSVTRVMTRSKSRYNALTEPLIPPKRSQKGTKKISKK